jgi:hypothetical protein
MSKTAPVPVRELRDAIASARFADALAIIARAEQSGVEAAIIATLRGDVERARQTVLTDRCKHRMLRAACSLCRAERQPPSSRPSIGKVPPGEATAQMKQHRLRRHGWTVAVQCDGIVFWKDPQDASRLPVPEKEALTIVEMRNGVLHVEPQPQKRSSTRFGRSAYWRR